MSVFNALMDPGMVGQRITQGFEAGMQRAREKDMKNALADFARDPNNSGAVDFITQENPQLGIQIRQQRQQQQSEEERKRITAAALNGDPEARKALAYYNSDLFMRLDDNQKQQAEQTFKTIGQTAFSILQLPPEQQGPALQQTLQGLQAQGVDLSSIDLNQPPEVILKSALAMAGMLDDWERFAQPNYVADQGYGQVGYQFGRPIEGGPQNTPPPVLTDEDILKLDGGPAGNGGGGF